MSRTSNSWWTALALVLCATAAFAEDRFESNYSRTLDYKGGRITVDHSFGGIRVVTGSSSQFNVRATIRASDPEFGRQIKIITTESPNISVRSEYPEHWTSHGNFSYSVDMTVTVPPNAPLSIHNRFGSIDAEGIHAASEFINSQGSINLREIRGQQRVENAFGSIEIKDSTGPLTIKNANGSINLRDNGGKLDVTNRFGSVEVNTNKGDVTISNANGSVGARDITGLLKIINSFASVIASDISGPVDVKNSNGRVEVKNTGNNASLSTTFASVQVSDIKGNLTVNAQNSRVDATSIQGAATIGTTFGSVVAKEITGPLKVTNENGSITASNSASFTADTRFGTVIASGIRGSADVDNANGSVKLTDIARDVKVRTSFGSVFVENLGGMVDIQNQNGAISVTGMTGGGCKPVTLRTSFSSIKVAVPSSANYTINAKTSFGRINSELPMQTSSSSDESMTGTIGNGGCRMELVNSNGSITIDRD